MSEKFLFDESGNMRCLIKQGLKSYNERSLNTITADIQLVSFSHASVFTKTLRILADLNNPCMGYNVRCKRNKKVLIEPCVGSLICAALFF